MPGLPRDVRPAHRWLTSTVRCVRGPILPVLFLGEQSLSRVVFPNGVRTLPGDAARDMPSPSAITRCRAPRPGPVWVTLSAAIASDGGAAASPWCRRDRNLTLPTLESGAGQRWWHRRNRGDND